MSTGFFVFEAVLAVVVVVMVRGLAPSQDLAVSFSSWVMKTVPFSPDSVKTGSFTVTVWKIGQISL